MANIANIALMFELMMMCVCVCVCVCVCFTILTGFMVFAASVCSFSCLTYHLDFVSSLVDISMHPSTRYWLLTYTVVLLINLIVHLIQPLAGNKNEYLLLLIYHVSDDISTNKISAFNQANINHYAKHKITYRKTIICADIRKHIIQH